MDEQLRNEVHQKLAALEKYRRKQSIKFRLWKPLHKILRFIYMPCLVLMVIASVFPVVVPFVLPFIGAGLALWLLDWILDDFVFKSPDEKFRLRFKNDLVNWLVKRLNPSFEYDMHGKLSEMVIENAQIFTERIDDYEGEDKIKGVIEGVDVELSEGKLMVDKITLKSISKDIAAGMFMIVGGVVMTLMGEIPDGGGGEGGSDGDNRNLIQFFNGLMMSADFNKSHQGSVHVMPSSTNKLWFIRKEFFNGKRRVDMDNAQFNKMFSTYTTGAFDANYVLTPAIMNHLVEIGHQVNGKLYLSVIRGKLFLAIDWEKDLFEADIKKPLKGYEDIEHIVSQIQFFETLVKKLALDKKIWSTPNDSAMSA